ncbi:apolipoprotein D-like [Nerophis lumbriciformis]|uniref:apolipoprotein D-like n=1 Tax=Nerophis lumbriciformis TaxID=546530 RepID=UPI002ADF3BA5|nr:apolipoprotein D-like [Nerophis lumbriciformis]
MKASQVVCLTLLYSLTVSAQVLKPGKCPDNVAVQADFDVTKYVGKWYDIERLPASFQNGECATALYTLTSPGVIGVLNSELLDNGSIHTVNGTVWVTDPEEPAKMEVFFSEMAFPGKYWVLSTDYVGHAVIYSCQDLGQVHELLAWILSREPTLSKSKLEQLNGLLTAAHVNVDEMIVTNQDPIYCSAKH